MHSAQKVGSALAVAVMLVVAQASAADEPPKNTAPKPAAGPPGSGPGPSAGINGPDPDPEHVCRRPVEEVRELVREVLLNPMRQE